MPIIVNWENRGVVLTISGALVGEEIISVVKGVYESERFLGARYKIADLNEMTDINISALDIGELVKLREAIAGKVPDVKVAVVSLHPLVTTYTSMYASWTEDSSWQVKQFAEINQARQWINSS